MTFSSRVLFINFICLGLSGCALTKLGPATAPTTYDLVSSDYGRSGGKTSLQLMVSEPTAVRALDTDRILIKPGPERISYFGGAVWSDRLPRLLQVRLVEALQSSGHFRAVASSREKLDADLNLSAEVRAFQVEVDGAASSAHVKLFLKVIDDKGRSVASKGFVARVRSTKDNVTSGVAALNEASRIVMRKVVRWAGGIKQASASN